MWRAGISPRDLGKTGGWGVELGARDQDPRPTISREKILPAPPPPVHSRFKPGHSGNATGKPKPFKYMNQATFEKIADKLIFMTSTQLEKYLEHANTSLAEKVVARMILDAMASGKKAENLMALLFQVRKPSAAHWSKQKRGVESTAQVSVKHVDPLDNPHLTLDELDALEQASKNEAPAT